MEKGNIWRMKKIFLRRRKKSRIFGEGKYFIAEEKKNGEGKRGKYLVKEDIFWPRRRKTEKEKK